MKRRHNIDFGKLTQKYPGFAWVDRCAELCGYNTETREWIVIDDGMCSSYDGKWIVHVYQLPDRIKDPITERCKYIGSEYKKFPETRETLIWRKVGYGRKYK